MEARFLLHKCDATGAQDIAIIVSGRFCTWSQGAYRYRIGWVETLEAAGEAKQTSRNGLMSHQVLELDLAPPKTCYDCSMHEDDGDREID
jgi:hypothetical protein